MEKAAADKKSLALANAQATAADREFASAQKEAAAMLSETQTPMEKLTETLWRAEELFNGGLISEETYFREMERFAEEASKGASKAMQEMREEAQRLGESLKTPLERAEEEYGKAAQLFMAGLVTEDVVERTRSNLDQIKQDIADKVTGPWADAMADMAAQADRLEEQLQTPWEKFDATVRKMMENPFIDDATLQRGIEDAQAKLEQQLLGNQHSIENKKNDVGSAGSREELSALIAATKPKDNSAQQQAQKTREEIKAFTKQIAVSVAADKFTVVSF
jgi:hypothetical protein